MSGKKFIFALLGFLLLGSGLAVAYPVNATVDATYDYGRWAAVGPTGNFTTEGGNISEVNITAATQLTDRWAGLFGNITATEIVLKEELDSAGVHLYNWSAILDGEICVSIATNFDFSQIKETTKDELKVFWNFGAVADNVTETFTGSNCSLVFTDINATDTDNADYIDHMGSSSFWTCVFEDTTTGPESQADFAFCTEINNSGTNYKGNGVDYELMVPTDTGTTETYYFYVEIN